MPDDTDQNEIIQDILKNQEFYHRDGKIVQVMPNGDAYEIDFDIDDNVMKGYKSPNTRGPPTNKNKNETAMGNKEQLAEDLTEKQYRDNYWRENDKFKEDGSTLMMEIRISKLKELHPDWSYEKCSKEVKKEMKKKGSENTNTEDAIDEEEIIEDAKEEKEEKPKEEEEEDEEEDKKKDKKKDMSEIDALKAKLAEAEAKSKKLEEDIMPLVEEQNDYIKDLKEKDAKRAEKKVVKKIEQYTLDFVIPTDKFAPLVEKWGGDKKIEFISDMNELGLLIAKKEPESVVAYNTEDYMTDFEKRKEEIHAKLRTV